MPGLAPRDIRPSAIPIYLVCGPDGEKIRAPEPPVEQKIALESAVAAGEVTTAAGSPQTFDGIFLHKVFDKLIFLLVVDGDGIHAVLAAQIPSVEPVVLFFVRFVVVFAPKVVVTVVLEFPETWKIFCLVASSKKSPKNHATSC